MRSERIPQSPLHRDKPGGGVPKRAASIQRNAPDGVALEGIVVAGELVGPEQARGSCVGGPVAEPIEEIEYRRRPASRRNRIQPRATWALPSTQ